jgi:hypothetical protein
MESKIFINICKFWLIYKQSVPVVLVVSIAWFFPYSIKKLGTALSTIAKSTRLIQLLVIC